MSDSVFHDFLTTNRMWCGRTDSNLVYESFTDNVSKVINLPTDHFSGSQRGEDSRNNAAATTWEKNWKKHMCLVDRREAFNSFIYPQPHPYTGELMWFRSSGKPVFNDNGSFSGYFMVCENITMQSAEDQRQVYELIKGMRGFETIKSELFSKAKKLLVAHHTNPDFSVHDVAETLNVSTRTLQREFARYGTSPKRVLNELRMDTANRLLVGGTTRTAAQACYQAGFTDYASFSRGYRRHFGHPPSVTSETPPIADLT